MKNTKYIIKLNSAETDIVIRSLVDLRNSMLEQGRYPDCVDDVIIKISKAPIKKSTQKVEYKVEYIWVF